MTILLEKTIVTPIMEFTGSKLMISAILDETGTIELQSLYLWRDGKQNFDTIKISKDILLEIVSKL